MKRFLSLTAILLTLTMTLALTACGGEEAPPEESTDPAQTETVDPAGDETSGSEWEEATPPGSESTGTPEQTAGVDLEALKAQLLADCGVADYIDVAADRVVEVYQLDPTQVVSAASFNATSSNAFPEEVVLVQAADEAAAAAVAAQFEVRLDSIAQQAASYDPASLALAESCDVVTSGVYVGLFFTSHYDAMTAAFQTAVG